MRELTEVEIGYAAGILDGEGCISVYPKVLYDPRRREGGYDRTRHLTLTVTITNTCKDVGVWLQEHFGGNLYCRKYSNHFKDLWHWSHNGRAAADILYCLEPHMIVKREEAQTALLFAETLNWPLIPTGKRGGRALSDETVRIRQFCYRRLHALKTKGRRPKLAQTRETGRAVQVA